MEKEKLIIRNFGPIKEVDLDLGRITVLIGEQATGKSTVAKVLAVCRYFSYLVGRKGILREIDGVYYSTVTMDIPFIDGLEDWGIQKYLQDNTYISYECKDYRIVFDRQKANDLQVVEIKPISNRFSKLLAELKEFNPEFYQRSSSIGTPQVVGNSDVAIPLSNISFNFYKTSVASVVENPFYLPAERGLQSIFTLGKHTISNISDSLFSQFAKIDEILRNYSNETDIEPLGIFYENRNGHGFVRKNGELDYHSLHNAASGYQSTIPLVLVIKYYNEIKKRKKRFLIEEPELNLFPSAQNKLIQYLVKQSNEYENRLLLTTHSPYTLTSLNNLMYAYQVGQVHSEKVTMQIDKMYWLNPDDMTAYIMKSDGMCESIIDDEGLIKAEIIDEVSKKINRDFNAIMDIELGVDEISK